MIDMHSEGRPQEGKGTSRRGECSIRLEIGSDDVIRAVLLSKFKICLSRLCFFFVHTAALKQLTIFCVNKMQNVCFGAEIVALVDTFPSDAHVQYSSFIVHQNCMCFNEDLMHNK